MKKFTFFPHAGNGSVGNKDGAERGKVKEGRRGKAKRTITLIRLPFPLPSPSFPLFPFKGKRCLWPPPPPPPPLIQGEISPIFPSPCFSLKCVFLVIKKSVFLDCRIPLRIANLVRRQMGRRGGGGGGRKAAAAAEKRESQKGSLRITATTTHCLSGSPDKKRASEREAVVCICKVPSFRPPVASLIFPFCSPPPPFNSQMFR